jgi:hypothetical protein
VPKPATKYFPEGNYTELDLVTLSYVSDAEEEFGIKRSQFLVHKKTLEDNQSFRKDPVTELLVAD